MNMQSAAVLYFADDEAAYLGWVVTHREGFVANIDRDARMPQYPMIHRATHAAVHSPKIGNFTTGDYVKYCAVDVEALRNYLVAKFRKPPTLCRSCMGGSNGARFTY